MRLTLSGQEQEGLEPEARDDFGLTDGDTHLLKPLDDPVQAKAQFAQEIRQANPLAWLEILQLVPGKQLPALPVPQMGVVQTLEVLLGILAQGIQRFLAGEGGMGGKVRPGGGREAGGEPDSAEHSA